MAEFPAPSDPAGPEDAGSEQPGAEHPSPEQAGAEQAGADPMLSRAERRARQKGAAPQPPASGKIHDTGRRNPARPRQWSVRRSG